MSRNAMLNNESKKIFDIEKQTKLVKNQKIIENKNTGKSRHKGAGYCTGNDKGCSGGKSSSGV